MRDSPGSHSQIKPVDHTGVEKLAQSHERLQGVSLHKPRGVSKLWKGGESWKVIKILVVHIHATVVRIAQPGATVENKPSDNGAMRLIPRNVRGWTLCR